MPLVQFEHEFGEAPKSVPRPHVLRLLMVGGGFVCNFLPVTYVLRFLIYVLEILYVVVNYCRLPHHDKVVSEGECYHNCFLEWPKTGKKKSL